MFRKQIEFICHEDYAHTELEKPEPVKAHIPDWYKKLEHNMKRMSVKGCMPVLDTLTAGYVLKMPQDLFIEFNIDKIHPETGEVIVDKKTGENIKDFKFRYGLCEGDSMLAAKTMNLNGGDAQVHYQHQLEGSSFLKKNKNFAVLKILNPWVIKTPPGYSCLFVPLLNNADDRFEIISGIVDTDKWNLEVNFPFVINGDKYETLTTTIKRGTPFVQVIPFKRDSWKMKLKTRTGREALKDYISHSLQIIRSYKDRIWSKKSWN